MSSNEVALNLDQQFAAMDLNQRFEFIANSIENTTLTTSLGKEDQLITHIIASGSHNISIAAINTGRLFQQTTDLIETTNKKYQLKSAIIILMRVILANMLRNLALTGSMKASKRAMNAARSENLSRSKKSLKMQMVGSLVSDESNPTIAHRFHFVNGQRSISSSSSIHLLIYQKRRWIGSLLSTMFQSTRFI